MYIVDAVSRISIPQTSHRHFPSLARRLGRIFAHAYYHHRLAFESAEAESSLYARFLSLSRHFDLVPAEFLVIPERNERGEEGARSKNEDVDRKNVTLLTRDHEDPTSQTSAIPTTSPSPRIGGRSRTDTMYLRGRYVSLQSGGSPVSTPGSSPDLIQSALAADVKHDQETLVSSLNDVTEGAVTQGGEGTAGVPEQEGKDRVSEQAPDAKDSALLSRTSGQVIARDFALVAPLVAEQEPPRDGAKTTLAPIEDVSCRVELAEAEMEREDTSSSFETLEDAPELEISKTNVIPTLPSDLADPTPAPSYSEISLAEPPLPVKVPHMTEAQVLSDSPVEDENAVEPAPEGEIVSEDAGAEDDEKKGEDNAKEEDIVVDMETLTPAVDAQQETKEGNMSEKTDTPIEGEGT